ncbi:hypothetical protein VTL71DRAFT_5383 [Oculimacula yallundae]|uniref:DUF7918 domain-containing protein n=1 Tax=Oculimacula yallundae TaxID=86028 RepID=A0ABR4C3G3_9HELO
MAVLDSLLGIKVTVVVDGETLEEYDTENETVTRTNPAAAIHQQARTVTKYIESKTGKEFLVRLSVQAPYSLDCPRLSFYVSVDGQHIQSPMLSKAKYAKREWSRDVGGIVEELSTGVHVTAMQFLEIQTTDEATDSATLKVQKAETSQVGEILIKIFRCSEGEIAVHKHKNSTFSGLDSAKKYHDKILVKDGKSHGVALGQKKRTSLGRRINATSIDGPGFPIGIFRFNYRSAPALQNLQVLPKIDSAGDAEQNAAVDSEDDELKDLDPELIKRVKKALARSKGAVKSGHNIKRSHSDSEEDVKPSKKAKLAKKKKQIGKTIVDLTEDSDTEAPIIPLD